jgi:hypothetical protein
MLASPRGSANSSFGLLSVVHSPLRFRNANSPGLHAGAVRDLERPQIATKERPVISIYEGEGDTRPTRPPTWATRPPVAREVPAAPVGADELRIRFNLCRLGVVL